MRSVSTPMILFVFAAGTVLAAVYFYEPLDYAWRQERFKKHVEGVLEKTLADLGSTDAKVRAQALLSLRRDARSRQRQLYDPAIRVKYGINATDSVVDEVFGSHEKKIRVKLRDLLKDADADNHAAASVILERMGERMDDEAAAILGKKLREAEKEADALSAAQDLSDAHAPKALEALANGLSSKSPKIREKTAEILAEKGSPAGVPGLRAVIHGGDPWLAFQALDTVRRLKLCELWPDLVELAKVKKKKPAQESATHFDAARVKDDLEKDCVPQAQ